MKLIEKIFSVKNENFHKVWTILGLKIKYFQSKRYYLNELNSSSDSISKNLSIVNSDIKNIKKEIKDIHSDILNKQIVLSEKSCEQLSRAVRDKFYGVVNGAMYSPKETFLAEAHAQTIDFIKNNMDLNKIMLKGDRISNLKYSLSLVKNKGLFLEFGVYSGETINIISSTYKDEKVYGFDSFNGLPENWNGWSLEKSFFKRANLPNVNSNVELVVGWFDESLPSFLELHNEDVAFLHVDCDIYSSAKYVLEALKNRIKPGTIIVFDEYFNFPNWQNHEYKAFMEFIQDTNLEYEYVSVGRDQVTIRII